jgi:hypothetical protein
MLKLSFVDRGITSGQSSKSHQIDAGGRTIVDPLLSPIERAGDEA